MGLLDDAKKKATDYAQKNPEGMEKATDAVIEKGGDAADRATGDKYGQQVDSAQQKADDAIGDKHA